MTAFSRWLVNRVFMVGRSVKLFKNQNPGEKILAAGGSKAICLDKDKKISLSHHWVFSKRAVLILTDKRLICGSWSINLKEIKKAQIYKVAAISGKGLVIKIETEENKFYQFGLQYDSAWLEQNVLNFEVFDGKLSVPFYSVLVRILALLLIIFYLMQKRPR